MNSGILNSYSGGSGSGSGGATSTGKQSAGGGLEGNGVGATGTSKSKGAAPMVTGMMGEMGMMAAVVVVGGAVGF